MESSTAEIFAGDRYTRTTYNIILCPLRAFVPDLHKILPVCVCELYETLYYSSATFSRRSRNKGLLLFVYFFHLHTHKTYRGVRFRVYAKWIFGLWKLDGSETYYEKSQLIFHIFFSYIRAKPILFHFFLYIQPRTQKCIKNYYIVRARKNDERKSETFPVWFSTSDA